MTPQAFDSATAVALLALLPAAVLIGGAALRTARAPWWSWVLLAAAAAATTTAVWTADHDRYTPDGYVSEDPFAGFDAVIGATFGGFGVALNGALVSVVGMLTSRRRARRPRDTTAREARLTTLSLVATAGIAALPGLSWVVGTGMPSVWIAVVVGAVAVAALSVATVWHVRRTRGSVPESTFPMEAVVALLATGTLTALLASLGSGVPDPAHLPDAGRAPRPTSTATATPFEDWPESYGPRPATTTSLDAAAIEQGTRVLLEDTVRWAGPLDDLTSPTPAPAPAPPVVLHRETCDGGGSRWTSALVLPTVRPQDLAPRVAAGWERAGYTAEDAAMGTETRWPVRTDAAVEEMRLSGDQVGVHVVVRSFCGR